MDSRKDGISTRLVAAVAAVWGLLIWANWFSANPLQFRHLAGALAAYGAIDLKNALAVWTGHFARMGCVAVLALAALGSGRPLARWLESGATGATCGRHGCASPASLASSPRHAFVHGALGAGALALGALGAGFAGLLFRPLAWIVVLGLAALGVPGLGRPRLSWLVARDTWLFTLVIALGLLFAFGGTLAPEVSYDALFHHLAHPQAYAAAHRIMPLPHHFLSHYPALIEMQYLLAYLLSGGPQAAKLVHFAWGLFTMAVLLGWAREHLEDSWALAAVAVLVLTPYFQLVLMWAYVDLGAAGYLTLVFWLVASGGSGPVGWQSQPKAGGVRGAGSIGSAGPAVLGALAGLSAGTKATGVFAVVLAGAVMFFRRWPPRAWAAFLASCFAFAVPWGARNWLITGNPFAPFLAGGIPTLFWPPENAARYRHELRSYEWGHNPVGGWSDFIAYPWRASVRNLGVLDPQAGMGGWFLWCLPMLLIIRVREAFLPALLVLGYFCLWLLVPRQIRYLLPAWPAAALASAFAVRALARRGGLALIPAWGAAVVLALGLAAALQRSHLVMDPVKTAFGTESAEEYMARGLPGRPYSVRASRWIRENMPGERLLIVSDYALGMYWGPNAIIQSAFDVPIIERMSRDSADNSRFLKRFRQAGVRRVLYSSMGGFVMQATYHMYNFDPGAAARWRAFWSACAVEERTFNDRYSIYRIETPAPARLPIGELRSPGGKKRPSNAVLPGLDEQWLGEADFDQQYADQGGRTAAELPASVRGYREIAERTSSPCAYERLGTMLLKNGKTGEGRTALDRAERLGRRTAILYDALGVISAQSGDLSSAIRRFRFALERDPEQEEARRNLAQVLWQVGDRTGAQSVLEEGLRMNPGSAELSSMMSGLAGRR